MSKIYLHIGHPKTGTSLIQSWLAVNAKILKDDYKIEYPTEDTDYYNKQKKGYISSGNKITFDSLNLDNLKKSNNTLLFSSEAFFKSFITNDKIQYLLKNRELKIFIYTRNVIEYLTSNWGQAIKSIKSYKDLKEHIANTNTKIFQILIDLIVFLKEQNIDYVVRNYSNHKNNLIQTFLSDLLSMNVDINQFETPENVIVNRSHDEFELELLKNYNIKKMKNKNFKPSRNLLSDYFINLNPNIKSYKPSLDIDTYEIILTKYKDQIDTLNKLLPNTEKVIIGDFEKRDKKNIFKVTKPQINTISKYLIDSEKRILNENQIDYLRNLSIKMHRQNNPDALALIRIAKQLRPQRKGIDKLLREFEEIYSSKKNEN